MKIIKNILVTTFCGLVCACTGFFDKDNTPPPSPLVDFKTEVKVVSLWGTSASTGAGDNDLKLVPAVTQNRIYTASKDGTVEATDSNTGASLWRYQTNTMITAGPTAADDLVLVGTSEGKVIALNPEQGKRVWQAQASSEILAPPVISHGIALAKAIDGKLAAFSVQDGHALWRYHQQEPSLILRGASTPKISNGAIVVGFANSNLAKLSLNDGNLIWQKTIAEPNSSFAIQRMVDIDADPIIFGNRIYVATYQGKIAALELSSGKELWNHDISSYAGITADQESVYVADASSHVWSFNTENGGVNWRQTQLAARGITGPAIMGQFIVVGDAEGYLHWLNKQDGHFVARTYINSSGIGVTPVVYNNVLYVVTKDGYLSAYKLNL
jgi:outer membrane protein assembly factor BamB